MKNLMMSFLPLFLMVSILPANAGENRLNVDKDMVEFLIDRPDQVYCGFSIVSNRYIKDITEINNFVQGLDVSVLSAHTEEVIHLDPLSTQKGYGIALYSTGHAFGYSNMYFLSTKNGETIASLAAKTLSPSVSQTVLTLNAITCGEMP